LLVSEGGRGVRWAPRDRGEGLNIWGLVRYPGQSMSGESAHTVMIVMVSTANQEEAGKIVDLAVGSRLAACASILPTVRSTYWWEGKMVNDQETLIFMKTTSDKVLPLQEAILNVHSYKVPEIIATSVTHGFQPYLDWVRSEVSSPCG